MLVVCFYDRLYSQVIIDLYYCDASMQCIRSLTVVFCVVGLGILTFC